MALTSVNISQQISANLTAQGIRSSIPLGGNNTVTDSCDIGFEFSLRCGATANVFVLTYANSSKDNKPTLHYTNAAGDVFCDQQLGTDATSNAEKIQDPSMTDVPAIAQINAVYYEAPTTNGGIVQATGSDEGLGTVDLKSAGGSALIIPRMSTSSSLTTTISFASASVGDVIKVVVLGNST